MATYLYQCPSDGNEIEVKHGMNEEPTIVCEVCEGKMERRLAVGYIGLIDRHFEGNNTDKFK